MMLPSLGKKTLSIDFGSNQIKVIEGKYSKNNIAISKALAINLSDEIYRDGEILDRQEIIKSIKEGLEQNKIRTDNAYGIINSSSVIVREITVPKVADRDIDSLIGYQLSDFLPVNPDEYVVNSIVLRNFTEGEVEKIDVLLIGVPKDIVLNHLELMKDIGLKPEILDFQGNAIAKLVGFNNQVNGFYNTKDLAIATVDMGYSSTKLTIINSGKIEVARVIEIGAKTIYESLFSFFGYPWEECEERLLSIESINLNEEDEFSDHNRLVNIIRTTIENIIEKIETVFRYYMTRESGNQISYIILQGGLSNIIGVDSLFSNHFNIPSVSLEGLDKIKWNGDIAKYSNAIGGLIRIDEVKR